MEHMGTMFDLKNRDFVGLTIELNGPCLQHHGSQLVGFGRSDKAFQVFNTLVDDEFGDYITQYLGDYNNPRTGTPELNQPGWNGLKDIGHCSNDFCPRKYPRIFQVFKGWLWNLGKDPAFAACLELGHVQKACLPRPQAPGKWGSILHIPTCWCFQDS